MAAKPTASAYNLFDQGFIDANRLGKLTPEQRAFLEGQLAFAPSIVGIGCQAVLLLFVLGVLGLIAFIWLATWETAMPQKIALGAVVFAIILAIIARGIINHTRKRRLLQSDLAEGTVRRVQGSLTFGKRGYQVEAGGNRLSVPAFTRQESLSPGLSYIFYYLPQSATVLSAEKISVFSQHQAREELTKILAQANQFNYPALALNRQGQLAEQQVAKVRSKLVAPLLFILLPLGFLGYQLYTQISNNGRVTMTSSFSVMAFIALALVVMGVFTLTKTLSDLSQRKVIAIEGQGYKDKRVSTDSDGHDSTDYYYVIAGQRFKIQSKAYPALIDGLIYRAYYTPGGKTLVNLEALESPEGEG